MGTLRERWDRVGRTQRRMLVAMSVAVASVAYAASAPPCSGQAVREASSPSFPWLRVVCLVPHPSPRSSIFSATAHRNLIVARIEESLRLLTDTMDKIDAFVAQHLMVGG